MSVCGSKKYEQLLELGALFECAYKELKIKKIRGLSKNADGIGLNVLLSAHFNINNNDYKFHNVCDSVGDETDGLRTTYMSK